MQERPLPGPGGGVRFDASAGGVGKKQRKRRAAKEERKKRRADHRRATLEKHRLEQQEAASLREETKQAHDHMTSLLERQVENRRLRESAGAAVRGASQMAAAIAAGGCCDCGWWCSRSWWSWGCGECGGSVFGCGGSAQVPSRTQYVYWHKRQRRRWCFLAGIGG